MSGYVNPMFRPDFTDYPASPQNRLASGFNAIWPASNPVGTETTQGMQSAAPVDQIAFMRPDGTPVMQSDLARAHEQVQTAMQVAPTMVLGMMGTTDPAGIRAFHGSPYDFERFDTSRIGTGEGAQAYGHGLYMAENEGVARSYKFAGQPAYMNPATASVAQDAYQQAVKSGVTDPLAAARNSLWEQRQATNDPIARRRIDDAYNNIEQLTQSGGAGQMYEVNIGADPEQFLHWDKPISEQSPQIQDLLDQHGIARRENQPYITGQDVHDFLSTKGDYAAGAQRLKDLGIPGIRYLDQGSRGAGQGTHNYVVFDANTIDILRKYGLAGLGIGLGAAVTGTQQQSQ